VSPAEAQAFVATLPPRLVKRLGADHVAWVCEQPNPSGVALSRARGGWDCSDPETTAAYDLLHDRLEGCPPERPLNGWSGPWYRYFEGDGEGDGPPAPPF